MFRQAGQIDGDASIVETASDSLIAEKPLVCARQFRSICWSPSLLERDCRASTDAEKLFALPERKATDRLERSYCDPLRRSERRLDVGVNPGLVEVQPSQVPVRNRRRAKDERFANGNEQDEEIVELSRDWDKPRNRVDWGNGVCAADRERHLRRRGHTLIS